MIDTVLIFSDNEDLPIIPSWKDKIDEHRESWESCEECLLRLCKEKPMSEVESILDISHSYLYVLIKESQAILGLEIKKKPRTLISDLRFNYKKWLDSEKLTIRGMCPVELTEEEVGVLLLIKCCHEEIKT